MHTIQERFAELTERGEKALVLFFTGGDPSLEDLPAIIEALAEGGADIIEVGIPFSDPFGEGPTIQASSQRALENGVTPESIFKAIGSFDSPAPIVTMGYYNPVLQRGLDRFALRSAESGSCGTIVSDLVPDESDAWCAACERAGISTIFLAAPTSTEERIREVCQRTTGFVYAVSRTGVTGAENQVPPDVTGLVSRIKLQTDKPVCVGFGVSKPEHVRLICSVADGAVIGSALVDLLHREWRGGAGRQALVQWVRTLKAATRAS